MKNGFTLSELLIALAILGVIATFTIPKVLQAQQEAANQAKLREAISMVVQIYYNGVQDGSIVNSDHLTGFWPKVNATRLCKSSAPTQGCWAHAIDGDMAHEQRNSYGFVMHSGVTVGCLDRGNMVPPQTAADFCLDANGPASPNLLGQDQIWLQVTLKHPSMKPGRITPLEAASKTLYEALFE